MPRWTPFEPYFWSLVQKTDKCWIWTGGLDSHGYGRIWKDGRRQGAHRVAYELIIGTIPPNLFACHKCDNPVCVNPSHIFLGTQKDNMQDWTKKGKNILINNPHLLPRGDNHYMKKPSARKKFSILRKEEFRSGRRVVLKGEDGKILGTKMVRE